MANLTDTPLPGAIPALYAATLLWLALAGWNPLLPGARQAIDLMLVMDESASIERAQNDLLWAAFLRQAESLPGGSRIGLMRFADRAVVEIPWTPSEDYRIDIPAREPPRAHYLDQGASDIRSAIDSARPLASPDRHTVFLISSDGRDTGNAHSAQTAPFSGAENISFFHLAPRPIQAPAAFPIDSVNLPAQAAVGQSLPLSIAIRSRLDNEASLEIMHNGQRVIKQGLLLQAGEMRRLEFRLAVDQPGPQLLEFVIRDPQQNVIDRLSRVVDAVGSAKLLYLSNRVDAAGPAVSPPPGWTMVQLRADQPDSGENFFAAFDVVVLDDLPASSLSPAVTRNLQRRVQQSATGLIVIGGPRSFGSGGYRHSALEEMLPVVAESARPLPAAAFLFLLDKSGSMDTPGNRQSRLADAFSAVLESAKSIRAGDESALLAFDREVQVLLPLQRRSDLGAELDRPWQIQAAGGTGLSRALKTAAELLGSSASPQRFLLLVTDGIVDVDNIGQLQSVFRQADIRLITLATGDGARLDGLRQLAADTGGQLLQVGDTAQLPRFLREQLEMARPSWSETPVTPRVTRQLPFVDQTVDDWNSLPGHQVTRARPSAQVYLASDQGDPLLVIGQYGAGRVAALPGGMLESAVNGGVAQALLGWINNRQANPDLQPGHDYANGRLTLVIDAVDSDNRWLSTTAAAVILTSPTGASQQEALELVAPGQYSAVLQAPAAGIYRAALTIGEQQATYSLYLQNEAERNAASIAPWYQTALDNATLKPWTAAAFADVLASRAPGQASRPWWLVLALITFLGIVAVEHRRAFAWLGNRLSRIKMAGPRH